MCRRTGVIVRGLGREGIPMYALPEVAFATAQLDEVAHLVDVRPMAAGEQFEAAGMRICPVRTSHDAAASCGFRFETGDGDALGYATDTGFATEEMLHYLRDVRILAIESNHDVRMLREGPYPRYLQDRILSDSGHLSNDQASDVVRQVAGARLEKVVAMHLSEHNNLPSLARESLRSGPRGRRRRRGGAGRVAADARQRPIVSRKVRRTQTRSERIVSTCSFSAPGYVVCFFAVLRK